MSAPRGAGHRRAAPQPRAAARSTRHPGRRLPALATVSRLVTRGLRRDAWLLVAWCAVVTLAVLVAVGGPRIVEGVLDTAVREAVQDAGRDADVLVLLRDTTTRGIAAYRADAIDGIDLPELRGVLIDAVAALEPVRLDVVAVSDVPAGEVDELPGAPRAVLTLLDDDAAARVRVVAGALSAAPMSPGEPGTSRPVEAAALPEQVADAWGLEVGDVLELAGPATGTPTPEGPEDVRQPARVEVTAVVAPTDASDHVWLDAGPLWAEPTDAAVPVLLDVDAAARVAATTGATVNGVVRLVVDPDRFSAAVAAGVAQDLDRLERQPADVLPRRVSTTQLVETGLVGVLTEHRAQARAAAAQMAVPAVGVVGVVAVVLLLVARLVVERRRAVLELQRARGAAVGVVVVQLAAEAVLVSAVACGAAVGLLAWLMPGRTAVAPLVAVLVAALGATPLLGARVARRAWSGVREPANRRDRDRLARRRAGGRLVAEAAVLALAVAAAAALRGRGLLQTTTDGTDPLLVAAPLLIAFAVTLVALRVYPWPVRALAAVARRSPGVLGVVGSARARRALALLPLLVLTLAASVVVVGLVLVDSVRVGQTAASWQRVGADARLDVPLQSGWDADLAEVAERLRADPAVDAASAAHLRTEQRVDLGNRDTVVTLIAVDDAFGALLGEVPSISTDAAPFAALAAAEVAEDGRVPALVDAHLASRVGERGITLTVGRVRLQVEVIGTTDHAPRGQAPGPYLYLPLDALQDSDGEPVRATVAWVHGTGAAAAVTAVADEAGLPSEAVVTRTGWLEDRRSSPLVGGVERTLLLGALVAVLLATVGLVATVLAGSRGRGRSLALLRTLGMRARLGWWFVLVELAPVVVAAVLAGTAAGVAVVGLLGSALGLDVLAGGPDIPGVVVNAVVPGLLAGVVVVLLLVAAAVEVAAHRRDRLSDVVRVGEAPAG